MSEEMLREKWDARYRAEVVEETPPSEVLLENRELLPRSGHALDLACGLGANSLWLARAGFAVESWDLSPVVIAKLAAYAREHGLDVRTSVRDVVAIPPAPLSYDLIVVAHFLERDLCPYIAAALRPGGVLFYQTFGPTGPGPSNPRFRLQCRELPALFAGLEPLVYGEEGEAKLVARRPQ